MLYVKIISHIKNGPSARPAPLSRRYHLQHLVHIVPRQTKTRYIGLEPLSVRICCEFWFLTQVSSQHVGHHAATIAVGNNLVSDWKELL